MSVRIERPALLPFSLFYGIAVQIRNMLFDTGIFKSTSFKIPVISVGNITVGGTGKTPHVEYLAGLLKDDYRLAVLSRGYKRKTSHFILATKKTGVSEIGDEPLQIKLKFPNVHVAVEKKRVEGVKTLMETLHKLELIILDDAYQHRYIKPGLSVLLIDYNRPIFNDLVLPAGNLREPRRNIHRADIILVTKCPENLSPSKRADFISRLHLRRKQDIFFTKYVYGQPLPVFPEKKNKPEPLSYRELHRPGNAAMLVTGIANPAPLRQFLKEIVPIKEEIIFPDHHAFTPQDFQTIKGTFETIEAEDKYIMVTEKDAVRIRELELNDKNLKKLLYYIPVEVKFIAKGEKPFVKKIYKFLKHAR